MVKAGWEQSGLTPFNYKEKMLQCSPTFNQLSTEEATRVINSIEQLREGAHVKGEVFDEDILAILGDIINTPIQDMQDKNIIQRRALWLNKEPVLNIRHMAKAKKDLAEAEALTRRQAKEAKDAARATAVGVIETVPALDGPPPFVCYCSSAICSNSSGTQSSNPTMWKGCPTCQLWFCSKKACSTTMLNSHRKVCYLKQRNDL